MPNAPTLRLTAAPSDLARAAALLRRGDLVAFPTETVYGLGADACNGAAVAGIFDAKQRPSFNPLIVHVAKIEAARELVQWSDQAERLAAAFWPGPLTLVLPLAEGHGIAPLVTAGLTTLAIRVPAHPTARALLDAFGGPVAAPSANPSGRISPTTAQHVLSGLEGRIAAVVDDGPCGVGVESTIVELSDAGATLLRPGGLAGEDISAALGVPLAQRQADAQLNAPGQMTSHYAPRAALRLNADCAAPGEIHLGFGPTGDGEFNLSQSGDLREAAANLFDFMHKIDALGRPIAVAPIPDIGLGVAINDRLRRAAAPRP